MKSLHRWIVQVASAAFFIACSPAFAQWQAPDHSVPIGRGQGSTGFKSAAPNNSGDVLTSNGAGADPSFITPPTYIMRAACNGVADDTAAINAGLAAGAGKTILFPSGTCKVTAALNTITTSGTYIQCSGNKGTTITTTQATGDVISFGTQFHGGVSNCMFASSVSRTAGSYIGLNGTSQIMISGNWFDTPFNAVTATGGFGVWLQNNTVSKPTSGTGCGFSFGGNLTEVHITDNVMVGNASPNNARCGIELAFVNGVWMSNNDVIQMGSGLLVQPANATFVANVFSSGDSFDNNTNYGILISPASGATVNRMHFANVWSITSGNSGVILAGAGQISGINFVNCFANANTTNGFNITNTFSTSGDILIQGCLITANSQGTSNTSDGINIGAGVVADMRIVDNRIGNTNTVGNTQRYGISVNSTTLDNLQVSNNNLTGNLTGSVLYSSTQTHNRFVGNIAYNPRGVISAPAVPASGTPVTNTTGVDVMVSIFGGTVSNVTVDGAFVANATPTIVYLPAGKTITLTYTVAPGAWGWYGQ